MHHQTCVFICVHPFFIFLHLLKSLFKPSSAKKNYFPDYKRLLKNKKNIYQISASFKSHHVSLSRSNVIH